ncbi:MAG: hypothetical protein AAB731_04570 [Patescibacteria group bacterium]
MAHKKTDPKDSSSKAPPSAEQLRALIVSLTLWREMQTDRGDINKVCAGTIDKLRAEYPELTPPAQKLQAALTHFDATSKKIVSAIQEIIDFLTEKKTGAESHPPDENPDAKN